MAKTIELSMSVKIWNSYEKKSFDCFFYLDTVYMTFYVDLKFIYTYCDPHTMSIIVMC